MPKVPKTPSDASAEEVTLTVDEKRAQGLLHEIAIELRLLGLHGQVAPLHVRALTLKREVARWAETRVPESRRQDVLDELLALQEETKAEQRKRR